MPESDEATRFVSRCEQWLCDDYSLDTRFIATERGGELQLFDATITLNPLPATANYHLAISVPGLSAGQVQSAAVTRDQLLTTVRGAIAGSITVGGRALKLPRGGEFQFHSTVVDQNTWYMPLTLQVFGAAGGVLIDRNAVDTSLRAASPPFDGAEDLRGWLGLRLPDSGSLSTITVSISPPVDLILDRSVLSDGILRLVLHAHPRADLSRLSIAVRAVPGRGLSARTQIAGKVVWGEPSGGRIEGTADIAVTDAASVLVMLLFGNQTVRRHWFADAANAPNLRYAAVKQFDTDLRMIRRGLFDDADSNRFETAVGALLFLLGFSSTVQLETDSPDLIVTTPLGRLVVVECTTRVADIAAKIGKLVDRREGLQKRLRADNAGAEVSAALVCRLPRDQVAATTDNLKSMRIVLVSAEDISAGLTRAWAINNPDEILNQALNTFGSA